MSVTPMACNRPAPLGISAHKYTFNLPISQILCAFFFFFTALGDSMPLFTVAR